MKLFPTLIICILFHQVHAKTCLHTKLSKEYNYSVDAIKYKDDGVDRIQKITITVSHKSGKCTPIKVYANPEDNNFIFPNAFSDCNSARSYITGFRAKNEVVDGDYDDFIVADFNGDKREDFAVKVDKGGNNGALYLYYIKNENGAYIIDKQLNEIGLFPNSINTETKTVTYIIIRGYTEADEYTYKAIGLNNWKLVKRRTLK